MEDKKLISFEELCEGCFSRREGIKSQAWCARIVSHAVSDNCPIWQSLEVPRLLRVSWPEGTKFEPATIEYDLSDESLMQLVDGSDPETGLHFHHVYAETKIAEQNSVMADLEKWRDYWHRIAEENGLEIGRVKQERDTFLFALEKTAEWFARNNKMKLGFWPGRIKEYWLNRLVEQEE